MTFKDVLYNLRSKRDISQAQLAKDLQVSPGLIGMYESGKRMPSVEVQEQLADYFNVTLDYLMGRDNGSTYYLEPHTAEIAKKIDDNPHLKELFEIAIEANPSDVELSLAMLKRVTAYQERLSDIKPKRLSDYKD